MSYAILEPCATVALDDYVAALAWAPDASRLAVAGGEGKVLLASFERETLSVAEFGEHVLGTLAVAWRPRTQEFATTGQDGIAVWDAVAGVARKRWRPAPLATGLLAYHPDGSLLASAAGRTVSLWTADCELAQALPAAPSTIAALAFDQSGRDLGAAINGGIELHRIERGAVTTRRFEWNAACLTVSLSANGQVLASGMSNGAVHLWYLASSRDSQMGGYGTRVTLTAFSSNSRYLATAAANDLVVWDFSGKGPEGSQPIQLGGHLDRIECFDWQPNGPYLVSGGRDSRVSLWWPGKADQAVDAQPAGSGVTAVRWSPDSRFIAVGERTGRLTIYELIQA